MPDITRRELLIAGGAIALLPELACSSESNIVAGGASDSVTTRHVTLKGSHEEIGRQLAEVGKSHKAAIAGIAKGAKTRREWFAANWPELYGRATGMAKSMNTAFDSNDKDLFSLGYNMRLNDGCSCSFYPGDRTTDGHPRLSRNYDFSTATYSELTRRPQQGKGQRGFTADPYIIETKPEKGIRTLMIVSYDLLAGCIDGMNEHGLAVALLADDQGAKYPSDGAQIGLGEIEVPRFLLERCKSVEECVAIAKSIPYYYTFIPCHYLVGDASGDSAVLEWGAQDRRLRVVRGNRRAQAVTNHLLSDFRDENLPSGNSFDRYRALQTGFKASAKLSPEAITKLHQSLMPRGSGNDSGTVHRTLWHSLYDLQKRELSVSFYLGEKAGAELNQRRSDYLRFSIA